MQKIIIQSIEKELPSRLLYRLTVGDRQEEAHIEVDKMYADYLVTDRIDPLVWGLLQFAINRGYDIESALPITEDLWYNLEMNFIDPLAANPGMHRIHIQAPLVPAMNHAGIVATGISCGVDSLYTIATHGENVPKPYRLTHLCFLMQVRIIQDYKMIHQQNYFKDVWICADVLPKNLTMALYLSRTISMNY